MAIDTGLNTIAAKHIATREYPAEKIKEADLSNSETKHIAGLMRVNHAGEIAAQALYLGQAITARNQLIREKMQTAASEEIDHLAWCETRLEELNSHISYLAPIWFAGSFAIGTIAGIIGDAWNLGFVAETEKQVVKHLETHLNDIPQKDQRTRKILAQMRDDEAHHQAMAMEAGAKKLPRPVNHLMGLISTIMTKTAYHV